MALCWPKSGLTCAGIPPVVFIQSPEVSGLNSVVQDGAVVLSWFGPQKFHPGVANLLDPEHTGRPGNTWRFHVQSI